MSSCFLVQRYIFIFKKTNNLLIILQIFFYIYLVLLRAGSDKFSLIDLGVRLLRRSINQLSWSCTYPKVQSDPIDNLILPGIYYVVVGAEAIKTSISFLLSITISVKYLFSFEESAPGKCSNSSRIFLPVTLIS